MIVLNGTKVDDFFIVADGYDLINGRKGDDRFVSDTLGDFKVDGGFGFDAFDFQALLDQSVMLNEIKDKTVIKIFDDATDERIQKIVLIDIEDITWSLIG